MHVKVVFGVNLFLKWTGQNKRYSPNLENQLHLLFGHIYRLEMGLNDI